METIYRTESNSNKVYKVTGEIDGNKARVFYRQKGRPVLKEYYRKNSIRQHFHTHQEAKAFLLRREKDKVAAATARLKLAKMQLKEVEQLEGEVEDS